MKKRIRRGDPQRQRYWEEMVRRCREGGQSVRAFCRAEGLRESAFYEISSQELSLILWGIDPASVKRQQRYQRTA